MCCQLGTSILSLWNIRPHFISQKHFNTSASCGISSCRCITFNTLRPRQNCRYFVDDSFKCIFLKKNVWTLLKISLFIVPKVRINNIPTLVQIMAWRRPGDKLLSEPMMVSLLTHKCVILPPWVNWVMICSFNRLPHFGGHPWPDPVEILWTLRNSLQWNDKIDHFRLINTIHIGHPQNVCHFVGTEWLPFSKWNFEI